MARMHPFHRTELLLGTAAYERLEAARVCVVGLGGVGAHAAEAIARSGVGHLTLVDFDRVCLTNLNRQLHALRSTVGQPKAELVAARLADVNPRAELRPMVRFYDAGTRDEILDRPYDAVVDCIDNLSAKLDLLETCVRRGLPVYTALGAGGRLDPTRVRVTDLSQTHTDPFARLVRKGLRERGIERGVTAVWSEEPPNALDPEVQAGFRCICPDKANSPHSCERRFQVQGTVAWMPGIFGLALAGTVVRDLAARERPAAEPPPRRTGLEALTLRSRNDLPLA